LQYSVFAILQLSDAAQGGALGDGFTAQGGGEFGEQPGAAEAAAADNDSVATGFGHHAQRVVGGEDIAVAQDRDGGDGLLEPGDGGPVGLAGIELGRGARVQGDRGGALGLGDAAGVEVGVVVVVDADAELEGHRHITGHGDHLPDDIREQPPLVRQRRPAPESGDLAYGATEVDTLTISSLYLQNSR